MRRLHLSVGVVTVILFLGTGLYMRMNFPALYEENNVIRYLFRANHVYLLFSGLINILLGLYHVKSDVPRRLLFQTMGSWMLILAPALFLVAFFLEPPQASPARPVTLAAVFLTLFGVVAHLVQGYRRNSD